MNPIKRGDIYYVMPSDTAAVGSEQQSGRPAVVVSDEHLNATSKVVEIVYLTTRPKRDMPQHVEMNSTGRHSTALCEQICAVSVTRLGEYCGHGSEAEMQAIDKALCASLGLTPPKARSELAELTAIRAQLDMMTRLYKDLLEEKIFG